MTLQTTEYSFILRAASPISQLEKSEGNVGILHREQIVLPSGIKREVPVVSGNAMRHGIREALANLTLDALGMLDRGSFKSVEELRFLYNGGAGSGSDGTIRIDEVRAMNQLVPSTAILGGTSRCMIHEGRIEVEPARLICSETEHQLAPWQREALADYKIASAVSYEALSTEYRHDESTSPRGRFLLTDEALRLLTERTARRERAAELGDEAEIEESKGGMMPYSKQVVIAGSLWTWSVVAHTMTDLDEVTVKAGLSAFLRRAVVGSGRRVAHGRFVVHAARGIDHLRPAEALRVMQAGELASAEQEAPFVAHVRTRADEARAWLGAAQ